MSEILELLVLLPGPAYQLSACLSRLYARHFISIFKGYPQQTSPFCKQCRQIINQREQSKKHRKGRVWLNQYSGSRIMDPSIRVTDPQTTVSFRCRCGYWYFKLENGTRSLGIRVTFNELTVGRLHFKKVRNTIIGLGTLYAKQCCGPENIRILRIRKRIQNTGKKS